MELIGSIAAGFKRAAASPFILLWLWFVGLLVAFPAAWIVNEALKDSIRPSLAQETMTKGFDMEWYGEYLEESRGIAATMRPTLTDAGPFLENLEGWVTGEMFKRLPQLSAIGGGYVLISLLMLGGVLDRYLHREERAGIRRFFGAGGRFFFRFVRLALISGALYASIYLLSASLFERMGESTKEITVESTVLIYSLLIWCLAAFLLMLVHMTFGYAKVSTVLEDRRSMLLAAFRGLAFVLTHPLRAFGQYYGVLLLSGLLLACWSMVAPGVGPSTYRGIAWAFVASQLFLLVRMFMRLSLLGGQAELYRTYTARIDREPSPNTTEEEPLAPDVAV